MLSSWSSADHALLDERHVGVVGLVEADLVDRRSSAPPAPKPAKRAPRRLVPLDGGREAGDRVGHLVAAVLAQSSRRRRRGRRPGRGGLRVVVLRPGEPRRERQTLTCVAERRGAGPGAGAGQRRHGGRSGGSAAVEPPRAAAWRASPAASARSPRGAAGPTNVSPAGAACTSARRPSRRTSRDGCSPSSGCAAARRSRRASPAATRPRRAGPARPAALRGRPARASRSCGGTSRAGEHPGVAVADPGEPSRHPLVDEPARSTVVSARRLQRVAVDDRQDGQPAVTLVHGGPRLTVADLVGARPRGPPSEGALGAGRRRQPDRGLPGEVERVGDGRRARAALGGGSGRGPWRGSAPRARSGSRAAPGRAGAGPRQGRGGRALLIHLPPTSGRGPTPPGSRLSGGTRRQPSIPAPAIRSPPSQ